MGRQAKTCLPILFYTAFVQETLIKLFVLTINLFIFNNKFSFLCFILYICPQIS